MAQPTEPESFTIFCILESETDDVNNAFSVNLAKTKTTVDDLRRAIKADADALTGYSARSIILYRTSIPRKGNFEENAKTALQTKLGVPMDKLETVFPTGPEDGMVHIIVRLPSQPPNQSPHVPRSSIAEVIEGIIADFQPGLETVINTFLHKNVQLPLWEPQVCSDEIRTHIAGLRIPKTSAESQFPSLLLHNLGQLSHDEQLANRVDRLFAPSSIPKSLFSAPGAGKTRLIFEGLWRRWGLYFTARTQPESLGSLDLENALGRLKRPNRLSRYDPDATSRQIWLVLYVRIFVFRMFLECASAIPGGITEEHKGRWLLLQLAPRTLLGRPDVFEALNELLQFQRAPLGMWMNKELFKIKGLLSKQPSSLFCVLDEAQVPLNESFDDSIYDAEPVLRPILPQIIHEWKQFLPCLIVSGTRVSMQEVETFTSCVGKVFQRTEIITDVGAFDSEEDQRAYLKSYVPQGYLESEEGKVMASRVGHWLHGRYRFTADYISRLMQAGFKSPNTVLNQFVQDVTNFRPSDCPDEGILSVQQQKLTTFDFSKLKKDEALGRQIAGCIFDYIFNGEPRDLDAAADQKLVEYGVARFVNNGDIKADKPLAFLAAISYINNETQWSLRYFLADGVRRPNESAKGIAFKQFGAYLLGLAFSSSTPLSNVFKFSGDNELKDETAQLVAIHKLNGESVCSPVDIHSSTATYIPAFSARNSEDSLSWMKDPQGDVFCFPANAIGPDLLLVLMLSEKTVIRVLVQFKRKVGTMGPADTEKALRSTDPEQFISKRTCAYTSTAQEGKQSADQYYIANPALSQQLRDALGDLGTGADNAGKLSVLRVLIYHATTPDADTLTCLADDDPSQHLVATVDLPSLARLISGGKILNTLALGMKARPSNGPHRDRNPDNEFEGPNSPRAGT